MGDSTMHAELSPSKRHRWAACPGSIREEARYPESPAGDAAIQGTRTHTILERAILWEFVHKRGPLDLVKLAGEQVTDDTGTWLVGPERADRVDVALEWLRQQTDQHSIIKAEQRVFPDGLVGRADLHGTVDIQIEHPMFDRNTYVVADYKDGIGRVEVENNPQLTQYGIGVLAGLPPERQPAGFLFAVIQPKNALKGLPVVTTWYVSTQDLLAMVPIIVAQAAATDAPNAPLVPGESQCKYCAAKGSCPALAAKVMKEMDVSSMFGPIDQTPDLAQQTAQKDPTKMTPAQLAQILEFAPLVELLIKGAKEEVKSRLEKGLPVPGYKLVRGPGSRDWALPEEEMVEKLKGMQMPTSAIYPKKLISPPQAEKATWEVKGETKGLSDVQKKRMNTEYVTNSPGRPIIAPESDPRPVFVMDASNLFGAIAPAVPSIFGAAPVPSIFGGPK